MVEALMRESAYKAFHGTVLMIGRQTVYFTRSDIGSIMRDLGLNADAPKLETLALDTATIDRKTNHLGRPLVSDVALMALLGADRVLALDHTAYEGADIIHDLRYLVPATFCGIADVIVDGSTLDNVFTPSVVLQNYARMLRPGGRLIAVNAFSGHATPYVIMPPLWYLDYFVMNGFSDCRVYIVVFDERGCNTFFVDPKEIAKRERGMWRIHSSYQMEVIVLAEKGEGSSDDRLPMQQDYRSDEDWKIYRANLTTICRSPRHHLVKSTAEQFFRPQAGHLYIDRNFQVAG